MRNWVITRRNFLSTSGLAACSLLTHAQKTQSTPADITLTIGPVTLEASPRHTIRTTGYNGQVPGPTLRVKQGISQTVEIRNQTDHAEVVHWHGLFLPPEIDGAMEEGTPMIAPGDVTRITVVPDPAGSRWYHTHNFAGSDMTRATYGGQHGHLYIEPKNDPGSYDREFFLTLHDWLGRLEGNGDGSMNPTYELSTINGKVLGFSEPLRVRQGERVQMHILNASPTETHWLALSGHRFTVTALDGNPVPRPQAVEQLRLAPAERVTVLVEMNHPGKWVLGEVRKHVQAAGMGIVVEYADATGSATWQQPETLDWDYARFAFAPVMSNLAVHNIDLVIDSKFEGHGSQEMWRINGKSYPHTDSPILRQGERVRLTLRNLSMDEHPIHLHRHTFQLRSLGGKPIGPLDKDVVLIPAQSTSEIEFIANNPGNTLLHCHQQNHMDRGFMMVFRYA